MPDARNCERTGNTLWNEMKKNIQSAKGKIIFNIWYGEGLLDTGQIFTNWHLIRLYVLRCLRK